MSARSASHRARVARWIADQRQWIETHGATLSGYVARYGSAEDPEKYGDGGEAIYAADLAELRRLEAMA